MSKFKIGDPVTPITTSMKGEKAHIIRIHEDSRHPYDHIVFSTGEVWMFQEEELVAL